MGVQMIAAAACLVVAAEGDVISARMPTPAEAAELGMKPWAGVPVIAITRADGAEQLFNANQARVIFES